MTPAAPPPGTVLVREADFNAGPRGPFTFAGFPGDPGLVDLRHGSIYQARMRDQVYAAAAAGGGRFVEIGAHIGGTTLHAAQFFGRVMAFEPCRRTLRCLEFNAEAAGMRGISAEAFAFSDRPRSGRLYLYPEANAVGHSLTEAIVRPGAPSEPVEVVTLDGHLEGVRDCAMLQIDAEGHDALALAGGLEFLARQARPPLVVLEFSPQMMLRAGTTPEPIRAAIDRFDYRLCTDAGHNWAPLSWPLLLAIDAAWRSTTAGWLDLYLVPAARPELDAIFPRL